MRRNKPVKLVAVEMSVEWPCQNQLLLTNTILPGEILFHSAALKLRIQLEGL
jgi:hypothetical protein